MSGHFWQATGENWESEFLQMGAYVLLTKYLFQRGSAESRDPDEPKSGEPSDAASSPQATLPRSPLALWLYSNSLCIGFFLLFILAAAIHAFGGRAEYNEEQLEHGLPTASFWEFLGTSEYWFQSFQNWQSEFLAVLSIVVLSIFLRQEGSPPKQKDH